jgi:hypothetical protein
MNPANISSRRSRERERVEGTNAQPRREQRLAYARGYVAFPICTVRSAFAFVIGPHLARLIISATYGRK